MKTKTTPFFIKFKRAIFNFDEYQNFYEEKTWTSIKYILKLLLFFALIITIALTTKIIIEGNKTIPEFLNECPDFSFKEYTLQIISENKKIVKGDVQGYFGIIADSQNDNVDNIEEFNDYNILIVFLKDKIVYKDKNGDAKIFATYKRLGQKYELDNINKELISNILTSSNLTKLYIIIALVYFVAFILTYLLEFFINILILSIVGSIVNLFIKSNLKYKSIFNISIYALTLSITLYMLYIIINIFTGFTIRYFEIAYNAIAYIYIITVIFMMKSNLIKQQIEVGKIVKEQKKIREEKEQEGKKQVNKEGQKPKKDKKEKNKKEQEGEAPEGNEA